MSLRIVLAIGSGSIVLLMSSVAVALTSAPSWETPEEVFSDAATGMWLEHFGSDRTLAYDHHGHPGIAAYAPESQNLIYSRRIPGIGWSSFNVDITGNVGRFPSLAFDRHERPGISYADEGSGTLEYAHFDGTSWQIATADASTRGLDSSLAFDLYGRPAIAYRIPFAAGMKFVRDSNGDGSFAGEVPVTVTTGVGDGVYATLAFDQLNRPMIVHLGSNNSQLRFSVEEPGIGWVTHTIATGVHGNATPSLAIDPDTGFPAISYADVNIDLTYAQWNGTSWDFTTVDDTGLGVGLHSSLAFDPADGNPVISYLDLENTSLKFAWYDGTTWNHQTVDNSGNMGYGTSVAFNTFGDGFPSIAYIEQAQGFDRLWYVHDPPASIPEPNALALSLVAVVLLLVRPAR